MTRPRLLMLTFTDISRDPRVLRHVAALREEYDIVTCGKGPQVDGAVEHLRVPDTAEHLPLTPGGVAALLLRRPAAAYRNLPAAQVATRLLRGCEVDVVLANDAATLPVAVSTGRPVVADMHEYAPLEMEEDWRWRLLLQGLAEWLCREHLPRVAAVTTVSPGLADRYRAEYAVDAEVVRNAGPRRPTGPKRAPASPVRMVHTGNANPNRRIETMIAAADGLDGLTLDMYLVRAPRTRGYLERLRSMAAATPNVRVLDPVPMAEVVRTLTAYDVGLYCLAPTSFNNLHALPNKFFDFVQAGLAVVVGPSPDMAALVEEFDMGAVAPGFEVPALRETLAALRPEGVARWQGRARDAARVLCAEVEAETLRRVIGRAMAVA
jgi:hypothetical protein